LAGHRPGREDFQPDNLWAIIEGCWVEDPSCRLSAEEVLQRLLSIISETSDHPAIIRTEPRSPPVEHQSVTKCELYASSDVESVISVETTTFWQRIIRPWVRNAKRQEQGNKLAKPNRPKLGRLLSQTMRFKKHTKSWESQSSEFYPSKPSKLNAASDDSIAK